MTKSTRVCSKGIYFLMSTTVPKHIVTMTHTCHNNCTGQILQKLTSIHSYTQVIYTRVCVHMCILYQKVEISMLQCWILPEFLIFLPVKRQRGFVIPGWTRTLFSSRSLRGSGISVQMILLHHVMSILFVGKGGTCISWGIIIQATGFVLHKTISRSWSTLLEGSCTYKYGNELDMSRFVRIYICILKSFKSPFTVNVERSCDRKRNVNVHHKKSAVKVVSDQRTRNILSLKPLALNC